MALGRQLWWLFLPAIVWAATVAFLYYSSLLETFEASTPDIEFQAMHHDDEHTHFPHPYEELFLGSPTEFDRGGYPTGTASIPPFLGFDERLAEPDKQLPTELITLLLGYGGNVFEMTKEASVVRKVSAYKMRNARTLRRQGDRRHRQQRLFYRKNP